MALYGSESQRDVQVGEGLLFFGCYVIHMIHERLFGWSVLSLTSL